MFKKRLEKDPPKNKITRKSDNSDEAELIITVPLKGAKGGVSIHFKDQLRKAKINICSATRLLRQSLPVVDTG